MARVSVPYITAPDGTRYYPVNHGGTVLYPRLESGHAATFSIFKDGWEPPALAVMTDIQAQKDENGYPHGLLNGRSFYVRTSGAGIMYYLKSSSGRMARVSAPYVTAADKTRYYPVSSGGTVLFPQFTDGRLSAYVAGSGTSLTEVLKPVI